MNFPSPHNLFLLYQLQYRMCISVSGLSLNPKFFEICVQMCICSDRGDGHGEMGWHRAGDGAEIFCKCLCGTAFVFCRFELRCYMGQQVCFCGKVKFCLFLHIKHWSGYLIKAKLYFYHVITKQKCCVSHNNVNSCELP